MSEIGRLEKQLDSVSTQIELLRGQSAHQPDDFSLSLTLKSLVEHRQDIESQLRNEKLVREREIVELRFKGKSVANGSVPLRLLGELSKSLSDAFSSGANQIRYGVRAKKIVPKDIIDILDLRLAGISHGSARLFITGRSEPDLFGNSLLENTLQGAFELLSAETPEALSETVGKLGKRTADSIDKFLRTVNSGELEVDITWNSPSDKQFVWEGHSEKILKLSQSLESIIESPPEDIEFSGELVTISMKGNFEVRDNTGINYRGTFSQELLDHMKEFHIGQLCQGIVVKRTVTNRISNYKKPFYVLKTIT